MASTITNTTNKTKTEVFFNPFPGLRPFGFEESHLFFGREGQSDEVLKKLSENRFAAVIGASGSGKSSLMYCGLIPVLYGGFITEAGSKWTMVTSRPGRGPIDNLARAIIDSDLSEKNLDEEEKKVRATITSSILRSSSRGLIEAIKQMKKPDHQNILVVVDQFEELFRFKKSKDDSSAVNESSAFVKLLLEAIEQEELPIYVVFTMRSDFIGDCAQFPNLTKLINDSHYLIPQMTRENFKDAVVGPVAVGGGMISSALVQTVLNDIGDNQDQLPILQHAMMRTWDYWVTHREGDEPMDVHHYESIGKLEKALSLHANEAYDDLRENEKEVCENIFKALTEKGGDNRGIRRPTSIDDLARICRVTEKEVIQVVDIFRKEGRSFLSPSISVTIDKNSMVDISHESLMRIWDRLKSWVEEEGASVQMYQRLCEAAQMYQLGQTNLWRPPDLQLAINWRDKQKPTLTWAERYNPAYERAMVFLETSEKAHQAEEENKLRLQKKALRRTRAFAIILGVFAILMLLAALYSANLSIQAEQDRKLAEKAKFAADKASKLAQKNAEEAKQNAEKAEKEKILADTAKARAVRAQAAAVQQKKIAENALISANAAKIRAQNALKDAEEARIAADSSAQAAQQSADIARQEQENAKQAKANADTLRMLSIAKAMALNSPGIRRDTTAKALVALGAWQAHNQFGGDKFSTDIYSSLTDALKAIKGDEHNQMMGHQASVRDIYYSPKGQLYSVDGAGNLYLWQNSSNGTEPKVLDEIKGTSLKKIAGDDNGDQIVVLNDGFRNDIRLYNPATGDKKLLGKGHRGGTFDVRLFNDKAYSVGSDSTIRVTDLGDQSQKEFAKLNSKIRSIDINKEQNTLAVSTDKGDVVVYDVKSGSVKKEMNVSERVVSQLKYSPDGKYLATGDRNGHLKVFDVNTYKTVVEFYAQKGRISDIAFSPDSKLLASASWSSFLGKGNVLIWQLENTNNLPLKLEDQETWVRSIDFSSSGLEIVVACNDGMIRTYPTNADIMAENLCSHIDRNLTKKEWDRYVDATIPYVRICPDQDKGNNIDKEVDTWSVDYPEE